MPRPAIQLYTLRDVELPFDELLHRVGDAGFDGVEFAYRVTEEEPAEVAATLEATGLSTAGAHVPIDALTDEFEETVAFYETLGCRDIVVPYLDAEHFRSEEAVEAAGDRLSAIRTDLAARGIDLHYHNHSHEFVDWNGTTGFDAFVDRTEYGIELDVGLAAVGGDDPVERLETLGDRTSLVHLKDVDLESGDSVQPGAGDLDLEACAQRARGNDCEWLIYEYEGDEPLASLEGAARTVSDLC